MIAFVAAERREFRGLVRHLADVRPLPWHIDYAVSGRLNGSDVVLAANGPGPALVRKASDQLKATSLDALVSIGFCGALSNRLLPADIFVATSVNGIPVTPPRQSPEAASGPLLSVDRVINSAAEKQRLHDTGADAVEMEAGELRAQTPEAASFHCIRVVTDTANESFPLDFNRLRDAEGRFSRPRIAFNALRRPFQFIPQLVQLDRRCRVAASTLGDFLANCQF